MSDSGELINRLKLHTDSVLAVRDSIGAQLHLVYRVTRTWTGKQIGDGAATDSTEQILPTPAIKEFAHDLRLQEGGVIRQGDILLKGLSKNLYPNKSDVDGSTGSLLVQRYYALDDSLYTVINVKENYVTWDVLVRKVSHNTRYKEM